MSEKNDKAMKDLIEEHGKEARDRWREVFDESRARAKDNDEAAKIADDVIRLEALRGVLVPGGDVALGKQACELAKFVRNCSTIDGKKIDPVYVEAIVGMAFDIVRRLES
jgi:hypothetical protein